MSLDLIDKNAGKILRTAPNGNTYWQYLGEYKCSFCGAIVLRRRPNDNNSCGCQQHNKTVYRKSSGPTSHIHHDRSWAVLHCAKYLGCLDRAIHDPDFKMNCKNCDEFEFKQDCFRDEIRYAPHGGDTFPEHGCWTEMR